LSGDVPERDPLADLVSRSIGARVPSVETETLSAPEGVERKRLRFTTSTGESSAIFERVPRGETVEAQLLPFLARKTDRVPSVHSRGLPPPHASLGPWILIEDVYAGAPACDGDPREVLAAKRAIESAVERDLPALRALGLRDAGKDLPPGLASSKPTVVHGDLACANALRVARGVVLVGWRRAFIGPAVLDAAALVLDLEQRDRWDDAKGVRAASGDPALFAEAERFILRAPRPHETLPR
jgi:hypothetical protein